MQIKIILSSLALFILLIGQASAANVQIMSKTVNPGETFDLIVSIDPIGTAISGAQLNLAFNNSIINVNSISEGNLFKQNGANTFFNSGIINNSSGTVVNIFGVILGPNNVSNSGSFIIINATAVGSTGTSLISLSNVIISNPEGVAIPLNVVNGSININTAPILAAIGNKIVNESQTLTFTLSGTDANGDALTYSASNLPSGATFSLSNRTFQWTPNLTQSGNYSNVRFEVSDGSLTDFKNILITVNDVNTAPILAAIGNKIVNESQTLSFTLSATDANGDALIYSASNLPSGASFYTANQTFQWTPNFTQSGNYSNVRFEVLDGYLTDFKNILITVNDVNRAPSFTLLPANGSTFNETDTIQVSITANDPDNDPLSYVIKIDGVQVSSSASYSWVTGYNNSGNHTIEVSIGDGMVMVNRTILIYIKNAYPRYDVNENGVVDIGDLTLIGQHFGQIVSIPYPRYDVNMDGVVNISDITITGQHFGENT